jgi:uncharacterized protein (DUF488 family)
MVVFTIGFTRSSAESFFGRLRKAKVKRVVDVRLNNVSQLAGFAKKADLSFFLEAICGIGYVHELRLAPEPQMLDAYRKQGGSWAEYEKRYLELLRRRQVEKALGRDLLEGAALLCSEDAPDHCHRRVAAEYLARKWGDLEIRHL